MVTRTVDRPRAIRDGVGDKPPHVTTAVLSDGARVIDPGPSDTVRVQFAAAMTLSAQMRRGRFDGQRVVLMCSANAGGASLVNVEANNVALDLDQPVDDWTPSARDTLSLVWDSRVALWFEIGRAANG